MLSSAGSEDSLSLANKNVIYWSCLGVIVSCAVGFYGGLLIAQQVTWLLMLIMVIGNATSICISMRYGYKTGTISAAEHDVPPAIRISANDEFDERVKVTVAMTSTVDCQKIASKMKTSHVVAPLYTYL